MTGEELGSPASEAVLERLGPADLAEGHVRGYEVRDRVILVSRLEGKWHAIDDWCNHAGCLLSGGRREGRMIVCPCHEVGFDLVTGTNLNAPEVCGDQEAFEIEERGGELWIRLEVTPRAPFR